MEQTERVFRKRFYAIAGCGACVLLALTWLFIKGVLSHQGFAVAALIWWIAMFAAIFLVIRSLQRSAEDFRKKQIVDGIPAEVIDRDRYVKNIRGMKRLAALFTFLLIFGALAAHDLPLPIRLAGAAFDAFIVAACVYSIVRSQRRLKELSAGCPRSRF